MQILLQIISIGFAVLSAGLWLLSAKVPLNLEYNQDEPFVLDLKVLRARGEQVTNDALIKAAFEGQSRRSLAAAVCALISTGTQVALFFLARWFSAIAQYLMGCPASRKKYPHGDGGKDASEGESDRDGENKCDDRKAALRLSLAKPRKFEFQTVSIACHGEASACTASASHF
jgi:hypothetical protein